jgi:hypothetical protein
MKDIVGHQPFYLLWVRSQDNREGLPRCLDPAWTLGIELPRETRKRDGNSGTSNLLRTGPSISVAVTREFLICRRSVRTILLSGVCGSSVGAHNRDRADYLQRQARPLPNLKFILEGGNAGYALDLF